MSLDQSSIISVEEVERVLSEIESKYSPIKRKYKDDFDENLSVLSKEFDSVGLQPLDLSLSITKIFSQVVSKARSLIHIHRKTLSQIRDVNIDNQSKNIRSSELQKTIKECKQEIRHYKEKNSCAHNKLLKLNDELVEAKKRESVLKHEIEKTKRFYLSKQGEFIHTIKKLTKENQQIKDICGKGLYQSRDDVALSLLNKYKRNEELYKTAIQKLEENNKELLEEILNLREQKAHNLYKLDCV